MNAEINLLVNAKLVNIRQYIVTFEVFSTRGKSVAFLHNEIHFISIAIDWNNLHCS